MTLTSQWMQKMHLTKFQDPKSNIKWALEITQDCSQLSYL